METVYLLPTTQASAALSVEWEWVRFVAFKLSPSHLRVPGKWLQGRLGGGSLWRPTPTAPERVSSVLLLSIPALRPTQQAQLLSPQPATSLSLGAHGHLHTTRATELPEAIYCTCLPG